MPDNSKITLKQLKDAMNMVKAYIDAEISAISGNNIPCTRIALSNDSLSFTTTDTQTLVATVTPTNCTDTVTWSVSPTGIATVNNGVVTPVANGSCTITVTCGSKSATCAVTVALPNTDCTGINLDKTNLTLTGGGTETYTLVATVTPTNCTQPVVWSVSPEGVVTVNNGLVTAVADGEATVTVTCGTQSATCVVIVSGMATASTALYELAEAKTFNGTSDYLDTGVTLLTGDNLNKDWTMLIDFTPTKLAQASIIHCMTESSPWPGMYLGLTTTGDIQIIFPNGSSKNNIVTATADQRVKLVIKKVGNTFTIYDSSMTSLHTNTPASITTTSNTVLLGALQYKETTSEGMGYNRFFTGTIHKFKIVEGDMSSSDCLSWMA